MSLSTDSGEQNEHILLSKRGEIISLLFQLSKQYDSTHASGAEISTINYNDILTKFLSHELH